jgi:hypothetical protein
LRIIYVRVKSPNCIGIIGSIVLIIIWIMIRMRENPITEGGDL